VKVEDMGSSGDNPTSLAELIASLPEEERIILTLHYLRSLSSAQIAEILKVPEKSVVVMIAAGKARLTSHLGL
jgi:DNA-directed RNA polymerase specialized sigma24 family protein